MAIDQGASRRNVTIGIGVMLIVSTALAGCQRRMPAGANVALPTLSSVPAEVLSGPPTTAVARLDPPGVTAAQVSGPTVAHRLQDLPGPSRAPDDKVVSLSFDDGPDPRFTAQVLEVLARFRAPATFFMVGRQAAHYPELVRAVAATGDPVEGHTWSHVDLTRLPDAGYGPEVDGTDALLQSLSGRAVRCVRPPRGRTDARVERLLGQRQLVTMLWSIDPRDWKRPGAEAISGYVLARLRPGAVILLHDGGGDRSQTVAALSAVLEGIIQRGYRVVPVC